MDRGHRNTFRGCYNLVALALLLILAWAISAAGAAARASQRLDTPAGASLWAGASSLQGVQQQGAVFVDVGPDHWAYADINSLYENGFVVGCQVEPQRQFCPGRTLNRAEAAVFVVRGVRGAEFAPPQPAQSPFTDVGLEDWYVDWVTQLWEDGYTAGCWIDPPRYCALDGHTRAEATVFFTRMLEGPGYVPAGGGSLPYSDVAPEAWYRKWVEAAYQRGIVGGCEAPADRVDALFRPEDPLTRAEAACMMARARENRRVLHVGPDWPLRVPSEAAAVAQDGDLILIDAADYVGDVAIWRADNLTIRGVGGRARLVAAGRNAEGKAIWVIKGDNTTVENIEFSGATVPDRNGAGIRQEGAGLIVRHSYFHNNENGILGGGGAQSDILIEYSEFAYNGYGDGYSHNIYISAARSLVVRFSYLHHARIGHNLKTRAQENFILYNRIMDEAEGTASYAIDIPDGGTSYIIGNLIQQGPYTDNSTMVSYGAESLSNPGRELYLVNNTLVNDRPQGGTFVRVAAGAQNAQVINNLFVGSGTPVAGPHGAITNLVTEDGGLKDRAGYDYRLTAASPAVDAGSPPGSAGDVSLQPIHHYLHPLQGAPRPLVGAIDIGAYEFSGAPVPTPTPSPEPTATATPLPTPTAPPSQTVLGALAASMAPGSWAELPAQNTNTAFTGTVGGATGNILPYSEDLLWDPIGRWAYFIGSDHIYDGQSDGPRFVGYSDDSNTWQILPPAPWFEAGTYHGYDHSAVNPANGDLYHRPFNGGWREPQVHKYSQGQWTTLPPLGFDEDYHACCVGVEYFPELGGLVVVDSGQGAVYLFDEGSDTWSRLARDLPMGDYHNFAEYNPVHKVLVFGGGNNSSLIYRLDARGQIEALGAAPASLASPELVFTVDPVSGDYLVFTSDAFYVYDVLRDAWELQSEPVPVHRGGSIFGVVATPVSTYGVNMFVVCDLDQCTTYLYRHSARGGG